ncbi:MAG: diaminopimelate epimerase [Arenimonas sp.]
MHGAGNDFVLLDLRDGSPFPDAATAQAIGDRHTGVGFDQLLTIEKSDYPDCIARYRILNSDGTPAQQCGNGARCVAAWVKRAGMTSASNFLLDSPAGIINVQCLESERYSLLMSVPDFVPATIPFITDKAGPYYCLTMENENIEFVPVSMGNPHAVIQVDDVANAAVESLGKALQVSPHFPESVNVGFAQIISPAHIKLRVYERGAGETLACGSGACAAAAALISLGKLESNVRVSLPGGDLQIEWTDKDAPIRMSGPTAFVFEGEWL